MRKTIIAVDFDGTICENKFPKCGKIKKGVTEAIRKLQEKGAIIILWTVRSGEYLTDAIDYCHENGIYPDLINENIPELGFETSNKIYADYYIDDRSVPVQWDIIGGLK